MKYTACPLCQKEWLMYNHLAHANCNCELEPFIYNDEVSLYKYIGEYKIIWHGDETVSIISTVTYKYVLRNSCTIIPFELTLDRLNLLLPFL